jgi:DNA-binding XRE family transcriptional regulator
LDDGREYTLVQLDELAAKLGQLIRRTTLYMLEQDGPSERSIRTIMERARCVTVD